MRQPVYKKSETEKAASRQRKQQAGECKEGVDSANERNSDRAEPHPRGSASQPA